MEIRSTGLGLGFAMLNGMLIQLRKSDGGVVYELY